MDDEEVLLNNDPLAVYLRNENIYDFETADLFLQKINKLHDLENDNVLYHICEDCHYCMENILKSELLLEEDYNTLDLYFSTNVLSAIPTSKMIRKTSIVCSVALIGFALFKYTSLKHVAIFSSLCALPLAKHIYYSMHRQAKNRITTLLLETLNKCSNSFKKYIRYINELSTTIGYYSSESIATSSINNAYIRFVKTIYATLLGFIKELAYNSTQIISIIPLKIENNLHYTMKEDLFLKENINIADLKVLFELYLLVQSDFVKTLGLSLCGSLWINPNSRVATVIRMMLTLTSTLKDYFKNLEKEYMLLRNYGSYTISFVRSPKKVNNSPSDYMILCLHNSELHFQQLLCKSRDLQNILSDIDSLKENDEKAKVISIMLSEMDKQLCSSKNTLENMIKYYYQIQNKTLESDNKVTVPKSVANSIQKTVEDVENDLSKPDKLTYELYIPKEGLPLAELEVDTERPVFCVKNLEYSNVLLQELRTILKARNPEIFEEQQSTQLQSESDDEETSSTTRTKKRDIFRPVQPAGLAENLQTISQVMAARKNMLQCEEICEDTFGSSDPEESEET